MRILLTGHEGYIGSGLSYRWQLLGHEVIGWGRSQNLFNLTSNLLKEREVDLIVNAAVNLERSNTTYLLDGESEHINFEGVRHLVRISKDPVVPLIQISSKDVFGQVYQRSDVEERTNRFAPFFEINDDQPFAPETAYAKTKLMAEFVTDAHPRASVVRLSSGYSEMPHRRGGWVTHFARTLARGDSLTLSGNGKQLRDLLHTDDLADLILCVYTRQAWGRRFNAGGGIDNAHSLLEVAHSICPNPKLTFTGAGDFGFISSNQMAQTHLGWKPSNRFLDRLPAIMKAAGSFPLPPSA